MTNREQLLYALKVQRLHEIFVLKDDIHLQYKYKNINRARNQAATFQDKIIDAVIEDAVTGTSDPISSATIKNNVENIIDTNLRNDTKRISHDIPKKAVEAAVSNISNRYQFILGNRIREEIPNLQGKIEDYITTNNLGKLPEADLTEKLKAEYGTHAQKRIQNIIKDSFHTNECNLSWVKAVYEGYQYKSWHNGRSKRTRVWHKAKFIQSVPIDETFDIFGSYPARMMYPGDLNGGAENVANCRCWLSYSNRPPSDLRGSGKKTTTGKRNSSKSNKSSKSGKNNNGLLGRIKNAVKKPIDKIKSKIDNISSKIFKNKNKPHFKGLFSEKSSDNDNSIIVHGKTESFNDKELFESIPKNIGQKIYVTKQELYEKFGKLIDSKNLNDVVNHFIYFKRTILDETIEWCTIRKADGTIVKTYPGSRADVPIPEDIKKEGMEKGIHTIIHNHPKGTSPISSAEDLAIIAECGAEHGISTNEYGTMTIKNNNVQKNKGKVKLIENRVENIKKQMIEDFEENNSHGINKYNSENDNHNKLINDYVNKRSEYYVTQYQQVFKKEKIEIEVTFIKV